MNPCISGYIRKRAYSDMNDIRDETNLLEHFPVLDERLLEDEPEAQGVDESSRGKEARHGRIDPRLTPAPRPQILDQRVVDQERQRRHEYGHEGGKHDARELSRMVAVVLQRGDHLGTA